MVAGGVLLLRPAAAALSCVERDRAPMVGIGRRRRHRDVRVPAAQVRAVANAAIVQRRLAGLRRPHARPVQGGPRCHGPADRRGLRPSCPGGQGRWHGSRASTSGWCISCATGAAWPSRCAASSTATRRPVSRRRSTNARWSAPACCGWERTSRWSTRCTVWANGRAIRLAYEDLMRDPAAALARFSTTLAVDPSPLIDQLAAGRVAGRRSCHGGQSHAHGRLAAAQARSRLAAPAAGGQRRLFEHLCRPAPPPLRLPRGAGRHEGGVPAAVAGGRRCAAAVRPARPEPWPRAARRCCS